MVFSVVIVQWGWFSMATRPVTASRMVAIGLLVGAIAITQLDRDSHRAVEMNHSKPILSA